MGQLVYTHIYISRRISRLRSQAKSNILVELLIMGARYMISASMGDAIVVEVRQSGHLGLLQVTSDLYRVIIICCVIFS